MTTDHQIHELMICRLVDEFDPDGIAVLGSFTPLAYAAYMLAKLTVTPDATMCGFNAVDCEPIELSFCSAEAALYRGAAAQMTFVENVNLVHFGFRGDAECVSSAQIDGTGAINLSVIGPYDQPKVRLPGGAGSPEVIRYYRKMLAYFGSHDTRTLVDEVDFVTGRRTPISPDARRAQGMLEGPIVVVTPIAVLQKDTDDQPFRLVSTHGGADADEVIARTGFELVVPDDVPHTRVPTAHELELLRERIDPFDTVAFDFLRGSERLDHLTQILEAEWNRAEALVAERSR